MAVRAIAGSARVGLDRSAHEAAARCRTLARFGCRPGLRYVIALLVVLAILLFITTSNSGNSPMPGGGNLVPFLFVIYLFAALFGGPQLNALAYMLLAFGMLLLTPVLIGVGYSIWVGTRPSQQAAAVATP